MSFLLTVAFQHCNIYYILNAQYVHDFKFSTASLKSHLDLFFKVPLYLDLFVMILMCVFTARSIAGMTGWIFGQRYRRAVPRLGLRWCTTSSVRKTPIFELVF